MAYPQRLRKLLAYGLILLAGAASALEGIEELEEALPKDLLAFFKIGRLPLLFELNPDNPVLTLLRDDEVREFFAPLYENFDELEMELDLSKGILEELGLSSEEFTELFPGQLVMALPSEILEEAMKGGGGEEPEIIALIEYRGGLGKLEELLEKLDPGPNEATGREHRIIEDKYLGSQLFLREVRDGEEIEVTMGYALVDEVLLVASTVPLLKDTVARLRGEPGISSFGEDEAYDRLTRTSGGDDVQFFVNLRPIIEIAREAVLASVGAVEPNPMGLTPERFFDVLIGDALEGIYLSAGLEEEESFFESGLLFREKKGITSLLTFGSGGIPRPVFIPPDASSFSVTTFSIGAFWTKLEELMFELSSIIGGMYQFQLGEINKAIGVDLRVSLIENLEDEITNFAIFEIGDGQVTDLSLENFGYVYAFGIKDRQSFELALDFFKQVIMGNLDSGVDPFEEREYLGHDIFSLKSELMPPGAAEEGIASIAYALTDHHFFFSFGSVYPLEVALARLSGVDKTIWNLDHIGEGLEVLPEGGVQIGFLELETFVRIIFSALVQAQETSGDPAFRVCNPAALPKTLNFPYVILGKVYSEPDRLFARNVLRRRDD